MMRAGLRRLGRGMLRALGVDPYLLVFRMMGIARYHRPTRTYVRNVMGHRMHVHTNDRGISRTLVVDAMREPESVMALLQYLGSDMTVLDLGANIGFYVLLEASVVSRGNGRIIAVEPIPENVRVLRLNVESNGYADRVTVVEGAVSDTSGSAQMQVSELSNCSRLTAVSKTAPKEARISVRAFTFAELLRVAGLTAEQLGFLRMDIEGAEYLILPSILDALEHMEPLVMFIEFHPHADLDAHKAALQRLQCIGYQCVSAVKEYNARGRVERKLFPRATVQDLYTNEFLLQPGGTEVFLTREVK